MPINGTHGACGSAIFNAIAAIPAGSRTDEAIWQKICEVLFQHIINNASVQVVGTDPPSDGGEIVSNGGIV